MTHLIRKTLSCSLYVTILLGSIFTNTLVLADVAVITHPDSFIGSIDKTTLKSIYLGKLKSWPDGSALTVIDHKTGHKIRKFFISKIIGKRESNFDKYWYRKSFSGKGNPPKKLANDSDIKAKISSKTGSIGYIDVSAVDNTIKVLMLIKQ